MVLVSNVWESDKDDYELNFVTVRVSYTGQKKKTVDISEDSAHCVEPADKCEKLSRNSSMVIKSKQSLIVLFYQLILISFFYCRDQSFKLYNCVLSV